MIADTSAVLAILFGDEGAESYARAISEAESRRMSAVNYVEAAIVIEAQAKERGSRQFDAFFRRAGIVIEPVTEEQAHAPQMRRQGQAADVGTLGAFVRCGLRQADGSAKPALAVSDELRKELGRGRR